MARQRNLTEHDLAVWGNFIRNVRAFPGRATSPGGESPKLLPPPAPREPSVEPSVVDLRPKTARHSALVVGEQPPGVDNATWRRLRGGQMNVERRLDLHGHTAQRAFVAMELLLRSARADGVRVVEIITGRGAGETGGVLRREVPLWLNLPHLRPMILAAAYPHMRNTGAIRLLLRR